MHKIFEFDERAGICNVRAGVLTLTKPSIELFDKVAEQIATEVAVPEIIEKRWNGKTKREEVSVKNLKNANKYTQIRKFYDELGMWVEKATTVDLLEKHLPFIKMLKAKAAYARGREHVDDKFLSFISAGLDQINTADENGLNTLRNFRTLFEAFMGFFRVKANG
jgi:CRISPR-associated protein Csm2